ncbi:hypothetical protein EON67_10420 [archaeon]|nr:MAG: hypothetical protein EON67_10420 [archaeon]
MHCCSPRARVCVCSMSVKPVGDAGSAPGGDDAVTEAVVKRFQELRGREQTLLSQISELEAQEVEHRCVRARARASRCTSIPLLQPSLDCLRDARAMRALCRVVVDALRPMDATRKCFHLVGGVLCERTVADVMPVIQSNKEGVRDCA